jgi:hypothetical protein
MIHLKLLETQEKKTNPQTDRWKEIIKFRAEINDMETKNVQNQ